MSVIPIDWPDAKSAAEQAATDVTNLIRHAPGATVPVPRLTWNVGEVAAHIVTTIRGYKSFARGESSSLEDQTMAEANEDRLRVYTSRDLELVADDIAADCASFLSQITVDDSRMSLNGEHIDRGTAAAVLLGELRIHGLDIARALKRPWRISRDEALMIAYAALEVAHKFVKDQKLRAIYEVRYRGGETVSLTFHDGKLTVARGPSPKADCRISADPVTGLLVAFGRISRFRAGLSGRMLVWGRKPWLAFRFSNGLASP